MTDSFKDLLDLLYEARMKDRLCELDMAKVTRAFRHILLASCALELAIDRAKSGIVEAINSRLQARLIHGLGVHDVGNTHVLDFLR